MEKSELEHHLDQVVSEVRSLAVALYDELRTELESVDHLIAIALLGGSSVETLKAQALADVTKNALLLCVLYKRVAEEAAVKES
jgi:hypothetical protein